jgi:glycosyltransferase involved in cell wall biosynthesis
MDRVFIDVSDILFYALRNSRITGIQRVEISILQFMIEHEIEYSLVNAFDIDPSRLDSIIRENIGSTDALLAALGHECQHLYSHKPIHKIRNFLSGLSNKVFGEREGHLADMQAGDMLFIPGAFWLATEIMRFHAAAAAKGIKLVVFIYDVLPVTHPHLMVKDSDIFFGSILKLPIHVITDSRSTESDLPQAAKMLAGAIMPKSIEVVPLAHEFPGVARNQLPQGSSERLKSMIGARSFVLYVGTVEIRKNHLQLMKVWTKLAAELGDALPLLVIAGKKGWEAEEVIGLLDAANERHKQTGREPVVLVEGPTDLELRWLYASCDFTVFPSLAEGWGLPVGESLWFGKACAASQATSIPEVGGDLCLYFDPENPSEIEAAIRHLLDPDVRAEWERKIRSAPLRTWQDAARDIAIAVVGHLPEKQPASARHSANP